MRTKWFVLLIAIFSALTLSGCGSNGGSGGDSTSGGSKPVDPDTGISYTNAGECIKCHQGFSWSADDVAAYLAGKHVIHSEDINAASSSTCLECHDPIGDGPFVEPYIDPAYIPAEGLAAVGCETCHGPGGEHFGVGPIPNPKPTYEACADCHNTPDGHLGDLYDRVINSQHNNDHGSSAKCQRCHTTEGSIAFAAYTGDQTVMNQMDVAPIPAPLDPVTNPLCMACHDPHGTGLVEVPGWDPNGNRDADEFDMCTSCHTYYNQDDKLIGSGSVASGTVPFYHNDRWNRMITTTHYDDPATGYGQAESIIEGYNLRKDSEHPCFDCHGHELYTNTDEDEDEETTIHTQWANSRHGGNLLEAKYNAVINAPTRIDEVDDAMMAGREDEVGEGWTWTHYDWDDTTGANPAPGARGRGSCQRCHTATGTSNYMTDPATYDPDNNVFSHLEDWDANGWSTQNEMLYCWGCHKNAGEGELRDPGGIVQDYAGDNVVVKYPDIINSNTCMTCHIGREIGQNIQVSTSDFTNTSFINSHYLAAGASVFAVSGFEYVGMNYTNVSFYAHDSIGTVYEVNTRGENLPLTDDDMGPCVGCHMTADEGSHNFLPYEFNDAGTDFAYITAVCAECHSSLTADEVETEEEEYAASLETLTAALAEIGIFFDPANYPYFFDAGGAAMRDWIRPNYPDQTDQQAGKNTMGAAFNLNLGDHDPGGFAHNRFYYKRLIWDAIDWVDDYVMNGSVPATISVLEASGAISSEVATATSSYLGDERPGTGRSDRDPIPGLDPVTNF